MNEFNAPFRILMGPGPSDCDPRVLRAMSNSMVSHLDPVFIGVMDDVQSGLRSVFETSSPITLPISGTGTAGMETAMVNMIEPGDNVVVCTAGFFADRMEAIAERAGGNVRRVEAPWGQAVRPEQLRKAIEEHRPTVVAFVHVETSTGVSQPIEPLAEVLRDRDDIVTIVDCVASLAGQPIDVHQNGLDFVYSGSQKCLSVPPGLAPITLSEKAIQRLSARLTPVQSLLGNGSTVPPHGAGLAQLRIARGVETDRRRRPRETIRTSSSQSPGARRRHRSHGPEAVRVQGIPVMDGQHG